MIIKIGHRNTRHGSLGQEQKQIYWLGIGVRVWFKADQVLVTDKLYNCRHMDWVLVTDIMYHCSHTLSVFN